MTSSKSFAQDRDRSTRLVRICVYCGSSTGRRSHYIEAAEGLAAALVARNIELVYGGASVGVMGHLADATLEAGGRVTGVIPERLLAREIAHPGLTELHVVRSMHERKAQMAELADGFIALPGGLGTLEELFEMLTWSQLGLHRKPLGALNVAGYYEMLADFLDHAVEEGFVAAAHRHMLMIESDPKSLLDRFETYSPPAQPKWIDREST